MTLPKAYHTHRQRVYIEDTDAGQIVYYANYLKFAERARTEMLRDVGLSHAQMIRSDGQFLAVRKCEIDYIKPAFLDDMLSIETEIAYVKGPRLVIYQRLIRDEELLVSLIIEIVCVGRQGKPQRLPGKLIQALRPASL